MHSRRGGKCREMLGNRFTFPEGGEVDVAERGFWSGDVVWAVEEVPGFGGKTVYFARGWRGGNGTISEGDWNGGCGSQGEVAGIVDG